VKVAFIHDHPFKLKRGMFYSTGGLPSSVWLRYQSFCDNIVVVGRELKNDSGKNLVISEKEGVSFHLIKEYKKLNDLIFHYKSIYSQLEKIILNVEAIIIRLPSVLGYLAVNICKNNDKHFAVEAVGCPWDSLWNYGVIYSKILALPFYLFMRLYVLDSKFVIYVTKNFLQKRYPTKGFSSHASNVEIENFSYDSLKKRIVKINEIRNNLKIGMIANLSVKYKGFDVAFKALKDLKIKGYNFKLYLVGGGSKHYVTKLAVNYGLVDNIKIVGRLKSGSMVYDFIDEIDLYLHPSKQEGLPRTIIEAMSRACPVLASSAGGIPELIDKKFLHKPGKFLKLSNQIEMIIKEPSILINMATNNFKNSTEYKKTVLDERRNKFWNHFFNKVKF
jgi:glycosyltransferase involved in cell wall biosynthesis